MRQRAPSFGVVWEKMKLASEGRVSCYRLAARVFKALVVPLRVKPRGIDSAIHRWSETMKRVDDKKR